MNYDIEVIHLESVKKLRDRRHSSLTSDDSLECCHRNNKRDIGFPITCFIGFAVCERCGVDGQLDRSASIAAANVSYQHGSAFFGLLRFGFLGFTHVQHIPSLGEVRRTFSSMIIKQSSPWNLDKKKCPSPGLSLMRGGCSERRCSELTYPYAKRKTFQPSLAFISASRSGGSGT